MPSTSRSKMTTIAAIAAAGLGGAALANAASSDTKTTASGTSTTAAGSAAQDRPGPPRDPSIGGHMRDGKTEKLLTGETADKVEAAAKAKVPGGTVRRVENDVDTGSKYEAHVRKSDGSEVVVYVNANFKVTKTEAHGHGPR